MDPPLCFGARIKLFWQSQARVKQAPNDKIKTSQGIVGEGQQLEKGEEEKEEDEGKTKEEKEEGKEEKEKQEKKKKKTMLNRNYFE